MTGDPGYETATSAGIWTLQLASLRCDHEFVRKVKGTRLAGAHEVYSLDMSAQYTQDSNYWREVGSLHRYTSYLCIKLSHTGIYLMKQRSSR